MTESLRIKYLLNLEPGLRWYKKKIIPHFPSEKKRKRQIEWRNLSGYRAVEKQPLCAKA